jgi:hypothetical protein
MYMCMCDLFQYLPPPQRKKLGDEVAFELLTEDVKASGNAADEAHDSDSDTGPQDDQEEGSAAAAGREGGDDAEEKADQSDGGQKG